MSGNEGAVPKSLVSVATRKISYAICLRMGNQHQFIPTMEVENILDLQAHFLA